VCVIVYSICNEGFEREEFVFDLFDLSSTGHFSKPVALAVARRLDIHTLVHQLLFGCSTDTANNVLAISELLVTNLSALAPEVHAAFYAAVDQLASSVEGLEDDDEYVDDVGKEPPPLSFARRGRGVKANEIDRVIKCICHCTCFHFSSFFSVYGISHTRLSA